MDRTPSNSNLKTPVAAIHGHLRSVFRSNSTDLAAMLGPRRSPSLSPSKTVIFTWKRNFDSILRFLTSLTDQRSTVLGLNGPNSNLKTPVAAFQGHLRSVFRSNSTELAAMLGPRRSPSLSPSKTVIFTWKPNFEVFDYSSLTDQRSTVLAFGA